MRMLVAAATASIALILAGCSAQTPQPRIGVASSASAPGAPPDTASTVSFLERQPDLEPHLFATECFMAAAYKRYQIPAAALDDLTAAGLEAYFVDTVYVATDQRCPVTQAAHTARNAPRLQAIQ